MKKNKVTWGVVYSYDFHYKISWHMIIHNEELISYSYPFGGDVLSRVVKLASNLVCQMINVLSAT